MEKAKENFFAALDALSVKGGVLVALSGGADSVCLLHLFLSAKKEGKFDFPLAAAHLNHSLRGSEADADESFCKELCSSCGIPFYSEKADVFAFAKKNGMGTEEAARTVRYDFLKRTAKEAGLSYIATAHNKNDMCETMILNLIRGSGIDGLCSIPMERENIIRPLLLTSREEILSYNNKNGIEFVTDSTNSSTDYSRNRVRLNILPEFEKIYAGYDKSLCRTAALLKQDADYLSKEADLVYEKAVKDGCLYTKKAQNIHRVLLSRVIKRLYNYHGFCDLTESHINAIIEKIACGEENFTLSLHASRAVCQRGKLYFDSGEECVCEFSLPLQFEKETLLPCGLSVTLSEIEGDFPIKKTALCKNVTVRSRREGDKITVFGKTHKIKRVISDKKLSTKEKAKLFFICSGDEIIYSNIPATADKAFFRKGDENPVYITIKETTDHE